MSANCFVKCPSLVFLAPFSSLICSFFRNVCGLLKISRLLTQRKPEGRGPQNWWRSCTSTFDWGRQAGAEPNWKLCSTLNTFATDSLSLHDCFNQMWKMYSYKMTWCFLASKFPSCSPKVNHSLLLTAIICLDFCYKAGLFFMNRCYSLTNKSPWRKK